MITETLSKNKTAIPGHHQRWERYERKFFVHPGKISYAQGMLAHICLRDSKYPKGIINSLYFDTPDLDLFQKSESGSYERDKVRIRWYDSPGDDKEAAVYLELKSKKGFASRKQRRKFLVPSERLGRFQADNTIIRMDAIMQTLSEFGYFSDAPLFPVILITYERLRFVDILTGVMLSLDRKISSYPTASFLGHSRSRLELEGGVIEVKGPSIKIPISLQPLISIGLDWTKFSKYAGCLESQVEKPGSVGRLWPSGRIESI